MKTFVIPRPIRHQRQRLNRSNKTHKVRGRFTPLPTFLEMTKWALGSKTKRQKFTYTFTAQTLN